MTMTATRVRGRLCLGGDQQFKATAVTRLAQKALWHWHCQYRVQGSHDAMCNQCSKQARALHHE